MKKVFSILMITILLTACASSAPQAGSPTSAAPVSVDPAGGSANPTSAGSEAGAGVTSNAAALRTSDVDHTHVALGDGKLSSTAQRDYLWSCRSHDNVSPTTGFPWLNGDGTWDMTKKLTVDGSVTWTSVFSISVQGDQRVFSTNDLASHPSGNFPINSADDAYAYDRNPNGISAQSISFQLPTNPNVAAGPSCVGGEVGIMLSGVVLFNSIDAEGHDAPAREIQDGCGGHPQMSGLYHYHNLSACLTDTSTGHSALLGYALDGFGIFGLYGEDGAELTNADLDECHGHTHVITWDGQQVNMFHYHMTNQFPYSVGCYRGTSAVHGPIGGGGGGGQPPAGGSPGGGPPP